jgi:hypothetical protein
VVFLILCFALCLFVTKNGSIFFIWTGIVSITGQVFLAQNGQRGSLLVCNWLHYVGQNHFHVMMLLNRDFVISSYSEFF